MEICDSRQEKILVLCVIKKLKYKKDKQKGGSTMKKRKYMTLGIIATMIILCLGFLFRITQSRSIGIIGGADGPTSIIVSELRDNPEDDKGAYFTAIVTEVNEESLFVEIKEKGSTALKEKTPVHVSTNFEGYQECVAGDCIRVEFNGVIQEIYPPIIPYVTSIEILP